MLSDILRVVVPPVGGRAREVQDWEVRDCEIRDSVAQDSVARDWEGAQEMAACCVDLGHE